MPTWSALPRMSRMRERLAPLCVLHAAARQIIVRTGRPVVKREQGLQHSKACRAVAANVLVHASACIWWIVCLVSVAEITAIGMAVSRIPMDHGHWHRLPMIIAGPRRASG
jgi:hypothetical protein